MDVRCFRCGTERSKANVAYYKGDTDLRGDTNEDDGAEEEVVDDEAA